MSDIRSIMKGNKHVSKNNRLINARIYAIEYCTCAEPEKKRLYWKESSGWCCYVCKKKIRIGEFAADGGYWNEKDIEK